MTDKPSPAAKPGRKEHPMRRNNFGWFTIFNDDGEALGEMLAHSEDEAIDMYLDDNPDCPDAGYLTAFANND